MADQFNIRVYGLLINEKTEILVTDEIRGQTRMTKFPGGGLEFGESLVACLKREWQEECGFDIRIRSHFYTTDFLQLSAFNARQQVISIYYLVEPESAYQLTVKNQPFDFDQAVEGAQIFRWEKIIDLEAANFTFPIDQKVVNLLRTFPGLTC